MNKTDADEIYLDIQAVETIADQFSVVNETLQNVNNTLETVVNILASIVFTTNPGVVIAEDYADRIKPLIKLLLEKTSETHLDVEGAILSYRDGDKSGSQRFAH